MELNKAPVQLAPYQIEVMKDEARFVCALMSRQIGKTFVFSLKIVRDIFRSIASGKKSRWVILSRGEKQAKEALELCKTHARAFSSTIDLIENEYDWRPEGQDTTYKVSEIVFGDGSKITALPANPDTARGFSGNVWLDEFAFHADSTKIWKAVFPIVTRGFKLFISSSANGKGNKFYEIWQRSKIFSKHFCDLHQAIAKGCPLNAQEIQEALLDDDAFEQEYLCQFLDEAHAYLSYTQIESCEHEDAGKPELYEGGPIYLGVDIARRNDLFVVFAWEVVGDVLWCREISVHRRITFNEQHAILTGFFQRYNVILACMDQQGMGEPQIERAKDDFGEQIEGLLTNNDIKFKLASGLKKRFEDRLVRIPQSDELREDFHKVRRIPTQAGNWRFDAKRDANGHSDRFWAAAMAIHAAALPVIPLPGFTAEDTNGKNHQQAWFPFDRLRSSSIDLPDRHSRQYSA
jgi:phage FluMu gp28-like protein